MSGLRWSMFAKLALFVLAEVFTDRQQLGRRLPSDYQQDGGNLTLTSSYTLPHVHRNDLTHACDSIKTSLVRKTLTIWPQVTHAGTWRRQAHGQPIFSAGYIRVSCGLYGPPVGVLWWHLRANTGENRVKYWQARTFCRKLRAAKISPVTCPQGLPEKVWQGINLTHSRGSIR